MAHTTTMDRLEVEVLPRARGEVVVPGALAGLAGGVLMVLWMVLSAVLEDREALSQIRPLGLTFLGEGASEEGIGILLYGLALHLAVSAVVGVIFTALLPAGFPFGGTVVVGIGYAWFVMSIITSVVLPDVNPTMRFRMPALGGSWVIAHGLYGFAVAAGPTLRARWRRTHRR